jgi:hypothetical protein
MDLDSFILRECAFYTKYLNYYALKAYLRFKRLITVIVFCVDHVANLVENDPFSYLSGS